MLYSPDIICALIDSIEAYGVYMAKNNVAASDTDSANIYYLTRLLRAIISDCCGINIHQIFLIPDISELSGIKNI